MDTQTPKKKPIHLPKDPFAYIGFWQFLTFIMLILLVWVNEIRDMPALLFNTNPQDVNIFRGCLLTAGVLVAAIVAIGNTYLQQQRVVKNLISVCSHCHRVRLNDTVWQKMEEYIGERSLLSFTHGLCPECTKDLLKTIENRGS